MTGSLRRLAACTLLLALALTGAACGDRAEALRERAARTYADLIEYEVVTEVISGGARGDAVTLRQSMRKPDSYRLDALAPDDIRGQTTIRNGRALWYYDSHAGELVISGLGSADFDSNERVVLAGIMAAFTTADGIRYVRQENSDGGSVAVVEYPDPAPGQEGNLVRLWADVRTGVPQRVEYVYSDGSVTQTVVFRDFVANPGLPADRFNFAIPPGTSIINDDTAVRSVSLEEARRAVDFQILLPTPVPDGYRLSDVSIGGSGDGAFITLSYTAGERLMQLYESKYTGGSGMSFPGATRQVVGDVEYAVDAADGFATISWARDGVSLSLTADTSLEELFSIAESLK
ncbi:MAG: hypothetical protein ACM3XN_11055 [Chloroflexota bacterium]